MTTTLDLSSLTDDGDTLELPDGRTLRLRIIPDEYESGFDYINGMDAMGRVAWCEMDRDTGYTLPRPEGFSGRSRKLSVGGRSFWWEPAHYEGGAEDVAGWTEEDWRNQIELVRDVVEYGPCGVVLEVLDGTDAYGRPVVIDVASIWSVEPFPDADYVRTLVSDLASELDL